MRKQLKNNFGSANRGTNQFKDSKKTAAKKPVRYIYTEEDLGEGILDVGINSPYTSGKRGNHTHQAWS